jgi:hypothetical protein
MGDGSFDLCVPSKPAETQGGRLGRSIERRTKAGQPVVKPMKKKRKNFLPGVIGPALQGV